MELNDVNGGSIRAYVSHREGSLASPDYFLVLPRHFMEEFKEQEKEFLARGGKFIVPLPQFEIVGDKNSVLESS